MSYKTILVHVDDSIHAAERIRVAATLAAEHGAHLTGVAATGVSRFAYPNSGPGLIISVPGAKIGELQKRARAALLDFDQRVRAVGVTAFESAPSESRQPSHDIALFLARHGVPSEVSAQASPAAVSPCMLSMACDLGSDLIVMGGYGHSRLREMLLGGATAAILESMTVPVLMSH